MTAVCSSSAPLPMISTTRSTAVQKPPDGINGIMREKGESQSQYTERVGNDLAQSISDRAAHRSDDRQLLFYPYGAYDRWMQPILEKTASKSQR